MVEIKERLMFYGKYLKRLESLKQSAQAVNCKEAMDVVCPLIADVNEYIDALDFILHPEYADSYDSEEDYAYELSARNDIVEFFEERYEKAELEAKIENTILIINSLTPTTDTSLISGHDEVYWHNELKGIERKPTSNEYSNEAVEMAKDSYKTYMKELSHEIVGDALESSEYGKILKGIENSYISEIGTTSADSVIGHSKAIIKEDTVAESKSPLEYPEDKYSEIHSGLTNWGGKGIIVKKLCCAFEQFKDGYDVFIDLYSGSATIAANETTDAKVSLCNDANPLAMIGANILARGGEYLLSQLPDIAKITSEIPELLDGWVEVMPLLNAHRLARGIIDRNFSISYLVTDKSDTRSKKIKISLKTSATALHDDILSAFTTDEMLSIRHKRLSKYITDVLLYIDTVEVMDKLKKLSSGDATKDYAELRTVYSYLELISVPAYRLCFEMFDKMHMGKISIESDKFTLKERLIMANYISTNATVVDWSEVRETKQAYECPIYDATLRRILKSENMILALYLLRTASSHMGAGKSFNIPKWREYMSSNLKLLISSKDRASMDAYIGNSKHNRFNRLRKFADKLASKEHYFTSFDYSVILTEFVPELLNQGKKVFLYCDPPYVGTAQEYTNTMGHSDHKRLVELLEELAEKGVTVAISLNSDSLDTYAGLSAGNKPIHSILTSDKWVLYYVDTVKYASVIGDSTEEKYELLYMISDKKLERVKGRIYEYNELIEDKQLKADAYIFEEIKYK